MSVLTVRPMQAGDLAFAASLTLGEQWHSETLEEFEGFFSRDPAGCLVAEQGGRRVGIGVATSYGDTGFLGQIVVHPEWWGQGIGDRMVGALLSRLRSVGVRSVYLDGTSAGVPLYERHGFRKVQPSLRYAGEVRGLPHPQVRPMRAGDLAAVCDLDREWWGEDRSFFLERRWRLHGGLCHVLEQDGAVRGYVLARRRGEKLWVGPWCAAADVDAPEALLLALVRPCRSMPARSPRAYVRSAPSSGWGYSLPITRRGGWRVVRTRHWGKASRCSQTALRPKVNRQRNSPPHRWPRSTVGRRAADPSGCAEASGTRPDQRSA